MTYRSDRDALETRRESLEADLRALREKASELQGVEAQIREAEGAIDEIRRRMESPEPVRRLPLIELDQLRVASPCTADWEKMQGDERVRFCGDCKLHVYNLSAMTRAEAQALVLERSGRTCVRFFRRRDGTMLTSDCPVGVRKKRVRRAVLAVAGAGAVAVAAVTAVIGLRPTRESCSMRRANPVTAPGFMGQTIAAPTAATAEELPPHVMMGDIGPEPPEPARAQSEPVRQHERAQRPAPRRPHRVQGLLE